MLQLGLKVLSEVTNSSNNAAAAAAAARSVLLHSTAENYQLSKFQFLTVRLFTNLQAAIYLE